MRHIIVPLQVIEQLGKHPGRYLAMSVCVDWPELQLSARQQLENGVARAQGRPVPWLDYSMFTIELEQG